MFCLLSRVLNEFDMNRIGSDLVQFHWYVLLSREKLVMFTESGEFMLIEPVELVNSLTEHVKSRVLVCGVNINYSNIPYIRLQTRLEVVYNSHTFYNKQSALLLMPSVSRSA